jgi:hypothetical protein
MLKNPGTKKNNVIPSRSLTFSSPISIILARPLITSTAYAMKKLTARSPISESLVVKKVFRSSFRENS